MCNYDTQILIVVPSQDNCLNAAKKPMGVSFHLWTQETIQVCYTANKQNSDNLFSPCVGCNYNSHGCTFRRYFSWMQPKWPWVCGFFSRQRKALRHVTLQTHRTVVIRLVHGWAIKVMVIVVPFQDFFPKCSQNSHWCMISFPDTRDHWGMVRFKHTKQFSFV